MEENKFDHIETGVKLISKMLRGIKKPEDANAKKELNDSVKLLKNKLKMMKKDESLAIQYLDRVKFDTIQGLFQTLHLYILSNKDDKMVLEAADWIREHESCYSIAERMRKAMETKADFNGVK